MAHVAHAGSRVGALKSRPLVTTFVGVLVTLIVVAFLMFVNRQIRRPLLYDEVNFSFAAEAVARIGIPFANAGFMSDRWDFSQREQWALWHPPLYLYALGFWYKVLGVSELVGRSFGVVCTLVAAGLVSYTARRLAEPSSSRVAGVLALAIFLLNPLTVQSSLILDIDGTILLTLVTLLTALYVRHVQTPRRWDLALLTGVFALALWAKMTTPIGLLFAMLGYRVLERRLLLGVREALIVGLGGATLFLSTYTLSTVIGHFPWELPFVTLWQEFLDASEATRASRESLEKFIAAVSPAAWWISPALLILTGGAIVRRGRDFLETRRADPIDVILILALGIFVTYLIKLAGLFPKYHITAMPFLAIAAAWLVSRAVGRVRVIDSVAWAAGLAIVAFYYLRVPVEWFQETFGSLDTLLVIRPLIVAVVVIGGVYLLAGGPVGRHAAVVMTMLVLGWSLGMDWRQSRVDFSTNYWYGSHGQREAAAYLDSMVSPDEFWGGAKEVAYYARNQQYIDEDTVQYWFENHGGFTETPINGIRPRILAVWTGHSYVYWLYHKAIEKEYEVVQDIGTYTILVRR